MELRGGRWSGEMVKKLEGEMEVNNMTLFRYMKV